MEKQLEISPEEYKEFLEWKHTSQESEESGEEPASEENRNVAQEETTEHGDSLGDNWGLSNEQSFEHELKSGW